MWTQTLQPPPSACSQEIASSKSLAVVGSIVKVGSCAQVAPPASAVTDRRCERLGRAAATGASKPRASPRSSISASITSRATSGRPMRRCTRAREPLPPRPETPGRHQHQVTDVVAGVAADGQARAGAEERLGDEELAAALDQRDQPASRRRSALLCGCELVCSATLSALAPEPFGLSETWMLGVIPSTALDAAAAEVVAVRREVLADGDVQRAAARDRLDLLEDALAVGVRADDRRRARDPSARR